MALNTITSHSILVYGFNPLTPLNLLPLLDMASRLNEDGFSRPNLLRISMREIGLILRRKGNPVQVHLRKEMFPSLRKSKLLLGGWTFQDP
ncbi:hypothetical protein CR513_45800, partial [Mucuna pruriens]